MNIIILLEGDIRKLVVVVCEDTDNGGREKADGRIDYRKHQLNQTIVCVLTDNSSIHTTG
jgi:hypothetical protein